MKLLISLFFCHWLADFTHLSRPYMLRAKSFGTPLQPILDHACVHGLLMLIAMIIYGVDPLVTVWLTVFQIATHFGIDVMKGKMNKWFPNVTDPTNVYHWYIFGFDQLLHSLVVIIMWQLSQ